MAMELQQEDALILVDVQNDFLPGGALAVPEGDAVIAPLNRAIELFAGRRLPIVLTRDWHPPDHCSFHQQGGPWPVHCVVDSPGAEFSPRLATPSGVSIVSKGSRAEDDSYSNFENTELEALLRSQKATRLFVGGLATEYCVRFTVQDALQRGFRVVLLVDGIRAIDVARHDGEQAIEEMARQGAVLASVEDLR